MSTLSKLGLRAVTEVPRNVAVLEAATVPGVGATCGYILEKPNEVTERLAKEQHAVVRVARTAGTEPPEICLEHIFQGPIFTVGDLEPLHWLQQPIPRMATVTFPGSSTDWRFDLKLHALVDPILAGEEVVRPRDARTAFVRALVEAYTTEEATLAEWDVDTRLQPPPILFRRVKARLRFIGKEPPRIAYDPERE